MQNQPDNVAKIAEAVANANNANIPARFEGLFRELKEEQLSQKVIGNHGLLPATRHDIDDEVKSFDGQRQTLGCDDDTEEDFENDENLTDMDSVSGSLRDIFNDWD
tara:strand:- start:165 stop:482 length:318 start_codon:yes stop_codon:yes gene_type:complete